MQAAKRRRRRPRVSRSGRWHVALGLLLAVGLSGAIFLALDPTSEWARYYFSSFFQGFAALLGIALTGGFIAFQLAVSQYGSLIATGRLTGDRLFSKTVALLALVLVLAGLGLGFGSLATPMGPNLVAGTWMLRSLSGLVALASLVGGYLAWRVLSRLTQSLVPARVLSDLANDLLSCERRPPSVSEEAIQNIVDALVRLGESEALFRDGWLGYLGAIRHVLEPGESTSQWRLTNTLCEPLRRLVLARGSTLAMAITLLSLTHEGVRMGSPGAFPLASLVEGLDDRNLSSAFAFEVGHGLQVLCSGGLPGEQREKYAKEVGLKLVFWAWVNHYDKVRSRLLDEKQYSARVHDLIVSLPASAGNMPAFADRLTAVIGLTRQQMQVIVERVGRMAKGEMAGEV